MMMKKDWRIKSIKTYHYYYYIIIDQKRNEKTYCQNNQRFFFFFALKARSERIFKASIRFIFFFLSFFLLVVFVMLQRIYFCLDSFDLRLIKCNRFFLNLQPKWNGEKNWNRNQTFNSHTLNPESRIQIIILNRFFFFF